MIRVRRAADGTSYQHTTLSRVMGMCLALIRLSDEAIRELKETPEKVLHFVLQDRALEAEARPEGILTRLFTPKPEAVVRCSAERSTGDETDVDKAWDALDFLYSDGRRVEGLPRFLTAGGTEIPHEIGLGNPRVIDCAEVAQIAAFLDALTHEMLHARFHPEKLDAAGVYPEIWERDGEDGFEYIMTFHESLRHFVHETATREEGLLLYFL